MNERVDDLEKYYAPIEVCDKWAGRTFFAGAVLSILLPYSNTLKEFLGYEFVSIFFILCVIVHSALSHYSGFYLSPIAEKIRRKQLLSDALNIPLTHEKTELYYNNEVSPSVIKLGANLMENSFFAKSVCYEMAKTERKKIFIYSLFWFVAILNRSTDLGLVLTLTQVLFSGDIIIRWVKVEILRIQNESIYEKLYHLYLNRKSSEVTSMIADILDAFASYEAAKASASIKQSSKIFNRLNPSLTEEWQNIRDKLQINAHN